MKHSITSIISKINVYIEFYKGYSAYRKAVQLSKNKPTFPKDSPNGYPITSRRPLVLGFSNPKFPIPEAYALIQDEDYEFIYVNEVIISYPKELLNFIILHEEGHLVLKHRETNGRALENELAADLYAIQRINNKESLKQMVCFLTFFSIFVNKECQKEHSLRISQLRKYLSK